MKALGWWASAVFRHCVHFSREQRFACVRRMGQQYASGTAPCRNLPIGGGLGAGSKGATPEDAGTPLAPSAHTM